MSYETLNKALDRIVALEAELAAARKDGERQKTALLDLKDRAVKHLEITCDCEACQIWVDVFFRVVAGLREPSVKQDSPTAIDAARGAK